ncbi:hypothetical protein DEO72_LG8g1548 [Vigna unguiculata]|uniref:Uncharacterized protein n=1 Tax=Vigna unguiculata TaxID=3917 RepID=A0A4D6MQ32_VIGUN|nr:hypothetical protein DEO72_LG8g1548 [Vigna unguiculata]
MIATQERQKLNDASYVLSEGGYALLEKHLRKSHATTLGLQSLNLISTLPRYEMWKAARTKFDGDMTSQSTQMIYEKIVPNTNIVRNVSRLPNPSATTEEGNLLDPSVRATTHTLTPATLANPSSNSRVPYVHLPSQATTQGCHSEPQLKEHSNKPTFKSHQAPCASKNPISAGYRLAGRLSSPGAKRHSGLLKLIEFKSYSPLGGAPKVHEELHGSGNG